MAVHQKMHPGSATDTETWEKQRIIPGQLTIYADRGSSMKSKPLTCPLADLWKLKPITAPTSPATRPPSWPARKVYSINSLIHRYYRRYDQPTG